MQQLLQGFYLHPLAQLLLLLPGLAFATAAASASIALSGECLEMPQEAQHLELPAVL